MTPSKTMLVQAVLFDLDGTLIDTAPDFAVVVNRLCQRHQQAPLTYTSIRATVSQGARALVTLAFGLQEGEAGFEALRQELLQLYGEHLAVESCLFPGMTEVLDWLDQQGLPWGIVTNKPRRYTEPILSALALDRRCAAVVCPDDVTRTKPDPEPMHLACRQLQRSADSTIYIGDHRRDIEAGKNAGMLTIAANYGYIEANDPSDSWQADYAIEHASELIALLSTLAADS